MTGLEKAAQILIMIFLVMVFSDIFVQFKFADRSKTSGCSKLNLLTNGFILPWQLRYYPLIVLQILIISLGIYLTLTENFQLF